MDNISLIISGNLTGFSRFYTSPNANDIYSETKFDFDYRNYLAFFNEGEKVYAISFAPTVIAVSLITRILDSFRRSGILVVTILMHRNEKIEQKIEGFGNSQSNGALYQLLNAVNEKFHEKNFINGMLNQNPSVLMQDYYSDILKDYVLVSDRNQHYINGNINVASLNKHIGYVASTEDNIALYLSSPCRRSYEGYHHVFLGKNAPQNIEEEPEEVIMYSVLVTNNKYRIPSVKLSDKIYNLPPEKGEIDFEKNYTYRQILAGEAGTQIHASLNGETIELTYRFGQEERSINFVFKDGPNDVPFDCIVPVIEADDGSRYKIFSESFSFQGKEIYTRKKLISGNAEYQIKPESSDLDISRIKDGEKCYIAVEKCFEFRYNFEQYSKNKTIILTRFNTDRIEIPNVIASVYKKLPGSPEDWEYTVESNDYESVSGNVAILLRTDRLNLGDKKNIPPMRQTFSSDNSTSNELELSRNKDSHTSRVKSEGILQVIGDGTQNSGSSTQKKKKNKQILVRGSLAIVVLLVLLVFIGGLIWPGWFVSPGDGAPANPQNNDSIITVKFYFVDSGDNKIKYSDYSSWTNSFLVGGPELIGAGKTYYVNNIDTVYFYYIYKLPVSNKEDSLRMSFKFDDFELSAYSVSLGNIENDDVIKIKLNVLVDELNECRDLKAIGSKTLSYDEWTGHESKLKKIEENKNRNKDFDKKMSDLLKGIKHLSQENVELVKDKKTIKGEKNNSETGKVRDGFNETTITLKILQRMTPQNDAEKARKEAIRKALTNLKENGGTTISKVDLSTDQSDIVEKIKKFHESQLDPSIKNKFINEVKGNDVNSLFQVDNLLSKNCFKLKE